MEKARIFLDKMKRGSGVIFYTDKKNFTQDAYTNRHYSPIIVLDPHERATVISNFFSLASRASLPAINFP